MKTSERAMQGFELASELDLANEIIDNWRIKRTVNHMYVRRMLKEIDRAMLGCHLRIKFRVVMYNILAHDQVSGRCFHKIGHAHSGRGLSTFKISPHEVQNETGDTRTNELRNKIEKSKKEKDRVIAREIFLVSTLTEINHRILKVDDEYKTTQQASEVLLEAQILEKVALLEAQMEKMDPNLNSISDYREKLSKYNERVEELTLRVPCFRLEEFMVGFNIISLKLKEVYQTKTVTESSPAIVLDDACIMERDFSCSLMGKMIKLFYLGGQWVLLELDSVTSKEKITNHVGVGSWFEVLKIVCEERLVWVAIEGLPVKALTRNTYAKIKALTALCHA
ncbi:hypothetical protein Tco_1249578 [Tanacetum coccineum]